MATDKPAQPKTHRAPQSGTYILQNVGAQKYYLDVQQAYTADGAAIIAWPLKDPPGSNQMWKFVRQSPDGMTCTLQSEHSNGFIYAISALKGTILVQAQTPVVWQLEPGQENFRIRLLSAKENLCLSFYGKGDQGVPVCRCLDFVVMKNHPSDIVLEAPDPNNNKQWWKFLPA